MNVKSRYGIIGLLILSVIMSGCFFGAKVGVVSGTVLYEDGNPVEGAVVRIGSQSATTNEDGKYTIKDVPHGDHVLAVLLDNRQVASKKVALKGDSIVVNVDDVAIEPVAPGVTRISFRTDEHGRGPNATWDFYVAEFDGEEVTNIQYIETGNRQKISPDGTQIVYEQQVDGWWALFVANSDGTNKRQVSPSDKNHMWASWSHDGTKISHEQSGAQLWVMDSIGGNMTQLTTGQTSQSGFSPDGEQIVYRSNRSGKQELYIINVDRTNDRQITFEEGDARHPSWQPNGNLILFDMKAAGATHYDVYVYNVDTEELINLTNIPGSHDHFPAWSPDGTQIIFTSLRDSDYQESLWVMDADGSNPRMILGSADYKIEWPSWGW